MEIPPDFYSLHGLVQYLNLKMSRFRVEFVAEGGRLKFAKAGGQDVKLKVSKRLGWIMGAL